MDLRAEKKISSLEETAIFWMFYSTWPQILVGNFFQIIEEYAMFILWQFYQTAIF